MRPIAGVARDLGIDERFLEAHGRHKAKLSLALLEALAERPRGKYVVVTAISPTPLGEGKTLNTIGLSMGLAKIGLRSVATIRQPSLGPIFGVKGGATGGGRSQALPADEINLHLTGDIHAVGAAHNLLAAFLDNHLHHGNALGIDPATITWPRVMDMNDRALRAVTVGRRGSGFERDTAFEISAASEVMAILALASGYRDLRERLGRIVVAATRDGRPVSASHLRAAGAMSVILRDALKPNLLQSSEGTPVLIHTGPVANVAHGNSSVLADEIALRLADVVVTETGFGADLGFEKFADIKCRASGLVPDAAVVLATVRGLKVQSGAYPIAPGKPLPASLAREDAGAVRAGLPNLAQMVEIVHAAGLPAVVAINRFETDTQAELSAVAQGALDAGADAVEWTEAFARGGEGAEALARRVAQIAARPSRFQFLYDLDRPIAQKMETIARRCYGADGVDLSPGARAQVERLDRWGLGRLAVCMAKTQFSLSHDAAVKGRPRGYRVPVLEVSPSAGAGFLRARLGAIMTMPGLPARPGGEALEIDDRGNIRGVA